MVCRMFVYRSVCAPAWDNKCVHVCACVHACVCAVVCVRMLISMIRLGVTTKVTNESSFMDWESKEESAVDQLAPKASHKMY